jgi:hypothetical protein
MYFLKSRIHYREKLSNPQFAKSDCETFDTPYAAPLHLPYSSTTFLFKTSRRLRTTTETPLRFLHLINVVVRDVGRWTHIVDVLGRVKEMRATTGPVNFSSSAYDSFCGFQFLFRMWSGGDSQLFYCCLALQLAVNARVFL